MTDLPNHNLPIADVLADVLILGAGLAGLCAAWRLTAMGYSVIVVEAGDRLGGYTVSQSVTVNGQPAVLDLGEQLLGAQQKHILRLAAELGVDTFPQSSRGKKVLEVGDKISAYGGTIAPLSLLGLLDRHWAISRLARLCKQVSPTTPHLAARAAEWDAMSVADFQAEQLWTKDGRALFAAAVRSIFAAEPAQISFLHFLWVLQRGGLTKLATIQDGATQARFVGGAQQLSTKLAELITAAGQQVRLNQPIHTLVQAQDRLFAYSATGIVQARYAILTIPLPLAAEISFQPALPDSRRRLHSQMKMGSAIQTIALYERPFWREQGLSGEILSCSNRLGLAFDASPADGRFGAMAGFLLGDAAQAATKLSAAERQALVIGELVRYLGMEALNPITFLQQDWLAEPWSKGYYTSYAPVGSLSQVAAALRQPCGRIHWAGSETAIHGIGDWDGAVEAGERAAQEVKLLLG